jgi:RimJ/RimL family protein N-acetyltransferase
MTPPEVIETERLRLRRPVMEDAAAIFSTYAQDPEVARFVSWSVHPSVDITRKFVEEYCVAGWKTGQVFPWLITLAAGGDVAGIIDLRPVATRAEIGYVLARRYWGRGLMTEAARAVVEWALAEREIYRVWAVVDLENLASQRVLEKVGMTREGVLRRWVVMPRQGPAPRDVWCFARVKEREATR